MRKFRACLLLFLLASAWSPMAFGWKFVIMGDTQTNDANHRAVLQAIKTFSSDYKFIINVGDLTDNGNLDSKWQVWKAACDEILGGTGQSSRPPKIMAAPGNHDSCQTEAGLNNWKTYLSGQVSYGNDGKYFSFTYENALFVILDSFSTPIDYQTSMLNNSIRNNNRTWLFAIWHHPLFQFYWKSYSSSRMEKWAVPLYNYGCDIMFQGHEHIYVRTKKMGLDGTKHPPVDKENGIVQIMPSAAGGIQLVPKPDIDGNEYMLAKYYKGLALGYVEVNVGGDQIRVRFIKVNGVPFETVNYYPNFKPGPSTQVKVLIQTVPDCGSVTVDGTTVAAPKEYTWWSRVKYTLSVPDTREATDSTQWNFQSWSNGKERTHTYTVPEVNDTLTATYDYQYYLHIVSEHGSPSGEGWKREGSTAIFSVGTPVTVGNYMYKFVRWEGDYTGTSPSGSVLMDGPKQISAVWRVEYRLTVNSEFGDPDGQDWYEPGETARVSVDTPHLEGDTRHQFEKWTGSVNSTQSDVRILMDAPKEVTAVWRTEHFLYVQSQPDSGGWINPTSPGVWRTEGTEQSVQAVADTGLGWIFKEWKGDVSGTQNPILVKMDSSLSVTAVFIKDDASSVDDPLPDEFRLDQNHPNPFNSTTSISFTLKRTAEVELAIRNTLGQSMRTLVRGVLPAGQHTLSWDGRDDQGRDVGSGVYVAALRSGGKQARMKLILVR